MIFATTDQTLKSIEDYNKNVRQTLFFLDKKRESYHGNFVNHMNLLIFALF